MILNSVHLSSSSLFKLCYSIQLSWKDVIQLLRIFKLSFYKLINIGMLLSLTAITSRCEPEELPYINSACVVCRPLPPWHCGCSLTICAFLVEGSLLSLSYIPSHLNSSLHLHFLRKNSIINGENLNLFTMVSYSTFGYVPKRKIGSECGDIPERKVKLLLSFSML